MEGNNPGSIKATLNGCICPIIANHYGKGIEILGTVGYWIEDECPIHGEKQIIGNTYDNLPPVREAI
jgi:hypothetical protein